MFIIRASLAVQWVRIHLPMQGTQVWPLAGEESTSCRATKATCHNHRVRALGPASHNYWARLRQPLKPRACRLRSATEAMTARSQRITTTESSLLAATEKVHAPQWRQAQSNINSFFKITVPSTLFPPFLTGNHIFNKCLLYKLRMPSLKCLNVWYCTCVKELYTQTWHCNTQLILLDFFDEAHWNHQANVDTLQITIIFLNSSQK